jgi:hypothetical protein
VATESWQHATIAGTFTFNMKLSDSQGNQAIQRFTIEVSPATQQPSADLALVILNAGQYGIDARAHEIGFR